MPLLEASPTPITDGTPVSESTNPIAHLTVVVPTSIPTAYLELSCIIIIIAVMLIRLQYL